ncbi:MAG: acyltransferase [Bacteroidota bacterium]
MNQEIAQKYYGLDHLRALAIFSVFLFHYFILSGGKPEWLPDFAKFGWTGVDLFFVLSGFLISSQLFEQINQEQKISFSTFFLKRFFRIVPAFLFTLGLYFCFPVFREKESLPPLWKFLTFTQNFSLNLRNSGTFSHAWSLCVEEHFYLVLPLLLIVLQRSNGIKKSFWLVLLLFSLGFSARIFSYNHFYLPDIDSENAGVHWYQYIYYPTYNRLDGLLVGVSIAAMVKFRPIFWSKISDYGHVFLIVGLGILTGAYYLCYEQQTFNASVFGFPLIAVGYGCMLMGAISPGSFLYKWNSTLSSLIASLSYAIYLTHKGIIHMTHQFLSNYNLNDNLLLLICIATCLAAAILLHFSIEKPFMLLRKKALQQLKSEN